jgi:hypothetical protein
MVLTSAELQEQFNKLRKNKIELLNHINKIHCDHVKEEAVMQENFKKEFPDYNSDDDNKKSSSVLCHAWTHVDFIFNNYIIDLYKSMENKQDEWYVNVRKFIEYHEENNLQGDTAHPMSARDHMLENEIKQNGFQLFVGDKCANIDEDEFDGPNDLSPDEWEGLDDIIIYYFNNLGQYSPETVNM